MKYEYNDKYINDIVEMQEENDIEECNPTVIKYILDALNFKIFDLVYDLRKDENDEAVDCRTGFKTRDNLILNMLEATKRYVIKHRCNQKRNDTVYSDYNYQSTTNEVPKVVTEKV